MTDMVNKINKMLAVFELLNYKMINLTNHCWNGVRTKDKNVIVLID